MYLLTSYSLGGCVQGCSNLVNTMESHIFHLATVALHTMTSSYICTLMKLCILASKSVTLIHKILSGLQRYTTQQIWVRGNTGHSRTLR